MAMKMATICYRPKSPRFLDGWTFCDRCGARNDSPCGRATPPQAEAGERGKLFAAIERLLTDDASHRDRERPEYQENLLEAGKALITLRAQPAGEVERLRERCEAYKGQVEAGGNIITALRAALVCIGILNASGKSPDAEIDKVIRELAPEVRGVEQ